MHVVSFCCCIFFLVSQMYSEVYCLVKTHWKYLFSLFQCFVNIVFFREFHQHYHRHSPQCPYHQFSPVFLAFVWNCKFRVSMQFYRQAAGTSAKAKAPQNNLLKISIYECTFHISHICRYVCSVIHLMLIQNINDICQKTNRNVKILYWRASGVTFVKEFSTSLHITTRKGNILIHSICLEDHE